MTTEVAIVGWDELVALEADLIRCQARRDVAKAEYSAAEAEADRATEAVERASGRLWAQLRDAARSQVERCPDR
jgi:hypothetical protein